MLRDPAGVPTADQEVNCVVTVFFITDDVLAEINTRGNISTK